MSKNVLIKTTAATAVDCTHIETVTGIAIESAEPANTSTKYLISVDGGKWRRYADGVWNFAIEQDLTAESVLSEGNTKAELTALTENSLTAFAGKKIDFAVAFSIGNNAEFPSVSKIEILGRNSQIKKDIMLSDVIKLSDKAVGITAIDVAKTETSGGAVNVYASVLGDNGEWSDYVEYTKIANKGKAIRFKAEVEADKPTVSTAILNSVKVHHWQDSDSAIVEGKSVLITKPVTLNGNVNRAHAIIKHPKIADTEFAVLMNLGVSTDFVNMNQIGFYEKEDEIEEEFEFIAKDIKTANTATLKVEIIQNSGSVENEILGVGNGKQQAFKLQHHARSETLQVNGSSDWTFKESTDTLLVVANSGIEISVSYDWIGKTTYLTGLACALNT